MPTSIESEVRSRVEVFANQLVAVVRASTIETVQEALSSVSLFRGGRTGARSPAVPHVSVLPKRAKRDPKELAALTERLETFIAKNPGQRIEQIGKALGCATKALRLPVRRLVGAKKISTKGQKRATKYYGRG